MRNLLVRIAAMTVRIRRGLWVASSASKHVVAAALMTGAALNAVGAEQQFPILRAGTQSFTNALVTRQTDAHLFITHAGGMATVKIADLDDATLAQLGVSARPVKQEPSTAPTLVSTYFSGRPWWIAVAAPVVVITGFLIVWIRRSATQTDDTEPTTGLGARIYGAACLCISAALLKWQLYDPLHAVELQRKMLYVSSKFLALGIVFAFAGILYLALGTRANRMVAGTANGTRVERFVGLTLIVAMILVFFLVDHYVRVRVSAQGFG